MGAVRPFVCGPYQEHEGHCNEGAGGVSPWPGIVSLAGGSPERGAFVADALHRMGSSVVREGATAFQYGPTEGHTACRFGDNLSFVKRYAKTSPRKIPCPEVRDPTL